MNSKDIINRIQKKKQKLDTCRPLPKPVLGNLKQYFAIEWTYNSNAIEGNTLTLQETRLVLEEGITIKGKSLREHFETKNHEQAINYLETLLQNKKMLIAEKDILTLHSLILSKIEEDFAGRYRNSGVRIVGANFVPPNAIKVPDMIKELVSWTNKNPEKLNIVSLVSKFHHKFVWIHPFFDGNGRTARLAMNLLLMKEGFPPAIILKNDRKKYYDSLNQANNGNHEKLTLLIAQTIERSLDMYLESVSDSEDSKYISLGKLAKIYPYSQEYLSLLARTGKLDAYKLGRNWVSSKNSVEIYLKKIG